MLTMLSRRNGRQRRQNEWRSGAARQPKQTVPEIPKYGEPRNFRARRFQATRPMARPPAFRGVTGPASPPLGAPVAPISRASGGHWRRGSRPGRRRFRATDGGLGSRISTKELPALFAEASSTLQPGQLRQHTPHFAGRCMSEKSLGWQNARHGPVKKSDGALPFSGPFFARSPKPNLG